MNYISFHVLLQKLVGLTTPNDPVLQGILTQLEHERHACRYTPCSNSLEAKLGMSDALTKDSYKATYERLFETITSLDTHAGSVLEGEGSVLEFFQTLLQEPWANVTLSNLTVINSVVFERALDTAKRKIKLDAPNREHYVLLIKAVLALKIYIARVRDHHPMPSKKPNTVSEAIEDFDELRSMPQASRLVRRTYRKVGQKACDFFMEDERVKCLKSKNGLLTEVVSEPKLLKIITAYLHTKSSRKFFVNLLFSDLVPADFNALYVKDLIDVLNRQVNVSSFFNPTGGWSGRLVGAMAHDKIKYYMETDPNTALHQKKLSIVQTYNAHETKTRLPALGVDASSRISRGIQSGDKTYVFNSEPVEQLTESQLRPQGMFFDMVFYSPPYFNLEKYPDNGNNTQSRILYSTITAWLNGFLYPSIEQSYLALKVGGVFAINIAKTGVHDLPAFVRNYMTLGKGSGRFELMAEYNYSISLAHSPSPVYVYRKSAIIERRVFNAVDVNTTSVLSNLNKPDKNEEQIYGLLPPKKRIKAMRQGYSIFQNSTTSVPVGPHDVPVVLPTAGR